MAGPVPRGRPNRLAHTPPPPRPRLRDPPAPLRSHDPRRNDRPHEPTPHPRIHPELARPLARGFTPRRRLHAWQRTAGRGRPRTRAAPASGHRRDRASPRWPARCDRRLSGGLLPAGPQPRAGPTENRSSPHYTAQPSQRSHHRTAGQQGLYQTPLLAQSALQEAVVVPITVSKGSRRHLGRPPPHVPPLTFRSKALAEAARPR